MSKKIISLFLVIVMLMGLAVPAMAAEPAHDISTGALAIAEDGNYTVTGSTTAYNISVAENVTATIILKDASIQLSDGSGVSGGDHSNMDGAGTAAIAIAQGANVTLILEGSNSLQGGHGRAAIEVMGEKVYDKTENNAITQKPATLTIKGSGSLNAQGGNSAAGIGGSFCMNAGIINIESGTITAIAGGGSGGDSGAGIGGGHAGNDNTTGKQYGTFKEINISGGIINANGVRLGAGIGAGAHGKCDGAVINITGGVITAQGGTYRGDGGDGIGLAHGGSDKTPPQVNISGNAVVNASSINTKNSTQGAGKTAITGGIVFNNDTTATMKADVTLTDSFTLPSGKTLTIPEGMTITVPADVVLTVEGAITGAGTVKVLGGELIDENGGIANTVTIDQGDNYLELKAVPANVIYGGSVTLTATAGNKADNSVYTAADEAVLFTIDGKEIASIDPEDGVAETNYTVDLPAGEYTVKASTVINEIKYSARTVITVSKANQNAPATVPSAAGGGISYGSIVLNAINDEGHGAVQYAYVEKPAEGEAEAPANWQNSTELTGLKAGTTYIVYARFAGNDCYNPSPAGNGVEIITTAMNAMAAPDLAEEGHTVTYKDVTLLAPEDSEVYSEAAKQYRMGTKASQEAEIEWGEWQSSNKFTGLTDQTTYYFQARYAITEYSHYSEASDAIEITTPEAPVYNVTIRVIGAKVPGDNPYRISENGETWGEWQTSPEFAGLQPGTTYYFQARYKAVHKYWLNSAESNTVEIKTTAATLAAPVLSADGADIAAHTITLAAVAASAQDSDATVMYYKSTDGENWGDGQQSRTFTGLEGNTKYYFAAQYISSDNNKYLDSAMSEAIEISTTFDENSPTFVVGSVTGRAGGTVDVTIEMKNNPGIISAAFDVSYDRDKLELTGAVNGSVLPNLQKSQTYDTYPYYLGWEASEAEDNITENGILATLTFKIKDGCAAGSEAEVSISYDPEDVYDFDVDNVEFAVVNGGVTVDDHTWSAVTYTWTADYSTCTAARECTDDGCDVAPETETVNATRDETPATCAAPGEIVYTAEFTNTAFQTQTHTEPLEKDDHIWVEVSGGDNAALVKTCTLSHTDDVDVSESTPVITIADVLSNNKNDVKVVISVKNNPGFKAMSFTLNYDGSKLQLLGAENKTTLTAFERSGNVITIGGAGENAEYTANGDIVILTFKALADCENASVALTYKIAEVYDAEAEEVLFAIDNGKVSAADFIAGDVNGDGKVDLKDVTYLRRHLANWDGYKSIVKFAADVDGDGFVEQKDVAYLLRHVAEYEGYEKLGR